MPDVFSKEVPELYQTHFEHLRNSAISVEVIKERGYSTIMTGSQLLNKQLPFTRVQRRSGILIPLHGVDGKISGHQLRPDHPREEVRETKVRKIKYENPSGSRISLDILPRCQRNLGNPKVTLFITEGIKKEDALVTAGAECVIGLIGVWGFKGRNPFGGKTVLPDWLSVALNQRLVYLVFDSDYAENSSVFKALKELTGFLESKGAVVKICYLPAGENGEKVGADDYLAQNHKLEDIIALAGTAVDALVKTPPRKQAFTMDGLIQLEQADFAARIVEVTTRDDGTVMKKFYHIIGRENDGDGPQLPDAKDVPVEKFESMDWVAENWDLKVSISPERNAKARIANILAKQSREKVIRRHIYVHTGWREIDSKNVFLTAAGAIGAPGIEVDLDQNLKDYWLPNVDGCVQANDDALKASFEFFKLGNPKVLIPLWASIYMAPLTSFIDPSFTLFLEGFSGTYKSGIVAYALNHYGPNFNYNRLPATWTGTGNALERLLYDLKDLILVIDDFAPAQDPANARKMEANIERVIRAQANRTGSVRMDRETGLRRTFNPRGFLITTGEHLPNGRSPLARTFVVKVNQGDIDFKRLVTAVNNKEILCNAMAQYIQWIAWHWDEIKKRLHEETPKWRNEAMVADEHPRLPNAVAQLYAGLNIGLDFLIERKIITAKNARVMLREGWATFLKWSAEQSEIVESERPARHFMEAFKALRNSGQLYFSRLDSTAEPIPPPGQTMAGWKDDEGNFYLNPMVAYNAVVRFCAGSDSPMTVKSRAIWNELKALGLTDCPKDRTQTRVRINGRLEWVVKLMKHAVDVEMTED